MLFLKPSPKLKKIKPEEKRTMLMLRHMSLPLTALIALSGPLIFLTGCPGPRVFPTTTIIEYDNKNKVCGQYKIVNFESMQVQYVQDIPCPSVFGFSDVDVPKVLDWLQDEEAYIKANCK